MSRLGRIAALCATIMLGASIAGATKIPSPFFPPDPWEQDSKSGGSFLQDGIPSPFFPPDPWEQDSKGGGSINLGTHLSE